MELDVCANGMYHDMALCGTTMKSSEASKSILTGARQIFPVISTQSFEIQPFSTRVRSDPAPLHQQIRNSERVAIVHVICTHFIRDGMPIQFSMPSMLNISAYASVSR